MCFVCVSYYKIISRHTWDMELHTISANKVERTPLIDNNRTEEVFISGVARGVIGKVSSLERCPQRREVPLQVCCSYTSRVFAPILHPVCSRAHSWSSAERWLSQQSRSSTVHRHRTPARARTGPAVGIEPLMQIHTRCYAYPTCFPRDTL